MSWLDMLTKPGLQNPNGQVNYYNSLDDVMAAASAALAKASPTINPGAPPTATFTPQPDAPPQFDATLPPSANQNTPQPVPPAMALSGGGPSIDTSAENSLPLEGKPDFQKITTDKVGNAILPNKGLTRLGVLAGLLKISMQGISDSIQSGSLNAEPGKSGVGAGFAGALNGPIMRQQRASQIAMQQAQMNKDAAQAQQATAESQNKNFVPSRNGIFDIGKNRMVQGSQPVQKQQFESLQQAKTARLLAIQAAGGDPNKDQQLQQIQEQIDNDAKSPSTPHTVATAKGVYQLNPDTGRYDIYVGPPVQEIKYDHPGDGSDPVMDRRLAQVEKTSTDALMAHGKGIASRINKLDVGNPDYANQMAAIERSDYEGKSVLAKGYAKQRSALGYQTDVPQFDPWTDSYLSDDERNRLLVAGDQQPKSSALLPWMKKGSSSTTKHLPGNPYAK